MLIQSINQVLLVIYVFLQTFVSFLYLQNSEQATPALLHGQDILAHFPHVQVIEYSGGKLSDSETGRSKSSSEQKLNAVGSNRFRLREAKI